MYSLDAIKAKEALDNYRVSGCAVTDDPEFKRLWLIYLKSTKQDLKNCSDRTPEFFQEYWSLHGRKHKDDT